MDVGRPVCTLPREETQLPVADAPLLRDVHEAVASREVESLRAVVLSDSLIKIVAQSRHDDLIGIDDQHPWTSGTLYGEVTRRFGAHTVAFGER